MEYIYKFSEAEFIGFSLVLLRLSSFTVVWPVFGVESVPGHIKILFALILAMLVFPTIDWRTHQAELVSHQLIWMVIKEVFLGLSFGFLAKIFFMACQIAGDLVSVSVGLSGAQLFNPSMGGHSTPLDQFLFSLSGLFFLAINGHHLFLMGIVDTFRIVPLGSSLLSAHPFLSMGSLVQEIVLIGLKMSAPVLLAILVINVAMGIVGKAVPQINVLVTSLSINILAGFLILIFALPFMLGEMPSLLEISADRLFQMMRGL